MQKVSSKIRTLVIEFICYDENQFASVVIDKENEIIPLRFHIKVNFFLTYLGES